MACPTCGLSILFGGVKAGKHRYCSKACYQENEVNRASESISDASAAHAAIEIFKGKCPKCDSIGQIDIHKSYSVYSVILYTKYETHEHLLCKPCASKQQTGHLVGSALLGWWGIPFGVIITPIIILMNGIAMAKNPALRGPTKALTERARLILASEAIARNSQTIREESQA